MNAKQCPHCDALSYSAYTGAQWICPNCGEDITEVAFLSTENCRKKRDSE